MGQLGYLLEVLHMYYLSHWVTIFHASAQLIFTTIIDEEIKFLKVK